MPVFLFLARNSVNFLPAICTDILLWVSVALFGRDRNLSFSSPQLIQIFLLPRNFLLLTRCAYMLLQVTAFLLPKPSGKAWTTSFLSKLITFSLRLNSTKITDDQALGQSATFHYLLTSGRWLIRKLLRALCWIPTHLHCVRPNTHLLKLFSQFAGFFWSIKLSN